MKFTIVFTVLLVLVASASLCDAEEVCICTDDYTPVCGTDGQTYGNLCSLQCAKGQLDYRGQCREQ